MASFHWADTQEVTADCSDWPKYRDCKMANLETVDYLSHAERCPRCTARLDALREKRGVQLRPMLARVAHLTTGYRRGK